MTIGKTWPYLSCNRNIKEAVFLLDDFDDSELHFQCAITNMKNLDVTEGLYTALSVYSLNGRNLKVSNLPLLLLFCYFF